MINAFTDGVTKLNKDRCADEFGEVIDLNSYQWLPGIIGATAWFNKLHVAVQESVLLLMQAIKEDIEETARSKLSLNLEMKIEPISSDVEAMHEQRAVEHACARAGQAPPDAKFQATWTAGWFIERVRRAGVDVEPFQRLPRRLDPAIPQAHSSIDVEARGQSLGK